MFKGSLVALITPFNNGTVDVDALKRLVDWHADEGTDGIVPCGTTGESPTLISWTLGSSGGGGMISTIILGVLGFIIVLVGAIQVFRGGKRGDVEELDLVTLTNSLTAGSARPVLPRAATPSAADTDDARSDEAAEPVEAGTLSPEEELRNLVDSQPDEVARLLRTWLADRRAVSRA